MTQPNGWLRMTMYSPDSYSDLLLADVARKIQLNGTDRDRALSSYRSIANHLDRPDSSLQGKVEVVYAQGSMAIDATIVSGVDGEDRYDIDAIAQLNFPLSTDPAYLLDELFKALDAGIYQGKVERQTRCVTVQLDRLHVDVTPMLLQPEKLERTGLICHHKPETNEKAKPVANPYGFARYFVNTIPQVKAYFEPNRLGVAFAESVNLRKAETEPLPPAAPVQEKPIRLLGLQLAKRYVNRRYANRRGRKPPGVYLAKITADIPGAEISLVSELRTVANRIIADINAAKARGMLIRHMNPAAPNEDCFTDRWPGNAHAQDVFLSDMEHFRDQIERLASRTTLEEKKAILIDLFGESPTVHAFAELASRQTKQMEEHKLRVGAGAGGVTVGSLLGGQAKATEHSVPQQRFYSKPRD